MPNDQQRWEGDDALGRDAKDEERAKRLTPPTSHLRYVPASSPYPRSAAFAYDPSHDARTRERVCEALRNAELDATGIDVYVANGEVTLIGTVDSLREEQVAVATAELCDGVRGALSLLQLMGSDPSGAYPRFH